VGPVFGKHARPSIEKPLRMLAASGGDIGIKPIAIDLQSYLAVENSSAGGQATCTRTLVTAIILKLGIVFKLGGARKT
jgi:hypothetical protein